MIEQVKCTKFLGIVIDEDLSCKQHTSYISWKISNSVGIVNRVKSILCRDLLKTLYYSLIHPYLQYCNIVWCTASKLALSRLICLQKRAVRLFTSSYYRAPSNQLFPRLCSILKISDIHRLQIGIFTYKAKHNLLPISCSYHVSAADINHTYPTSIACSKHI